MTRTVRWLLIAVCAYLVLFHLPVRAAWVFGPLLAIAVALGQTSASRLASRLNSPRRRKQPLTPPIG